MRKWSSVYTCACVAVMLLTGVHSTASAATIRVPAGGNLQAAINSARAGDTILLAAGATFTGNFVLPVHGGTSYVTIRSDAPDTLLPGPGTRITPAYAPYLAKVQSPNNMPAFRFRPAAAFWRLLLLELPHNKNGYGEIVELGDPTDAQNTLALVPHHLIVDRVYMHGDHLAGQKRGIALNSGETTIVNCYISNIKGVAQDTQAIGGWNGPGPYVIENNYLEASGNSFLLGGNDPAIPNLVPSDLRFRGNTLTRPLSWRDPIFNRPAGVSASAGAGGSLAAGTYAYRVVARRPIGGTTITSLASTEVPVAVAAGGSVTIAWNAVPDAKEYRVYGRTPGAPDKYWTVTTTKFTDLGTGGTAGTPPSTATVWQVKNLFELKNTRRALVDYNVMENNWQQAQAGVAVLLTVRNQYGGCTWCVVEDVTFEYNVVRHVGAGVKILGIDYNYPSQQTNNIVIRHNEFSDVDKFWGGSGYFLQLADNPRDIKVLNNTIISNNGGGMVTAGGPTIYGFVWEKNLSRHNSYGIQGTGKGYGNTALAFYMPDASVTGNVIAGGSASKYPAGNEFPTLAQFQAQFVNYAGGDFRLVPGSNWALQGLGADIAKIRAGIGTSPGAPPEVVTKNLAGATEGDGYSATLEASGGNAPYQWSVIAGALPGGIMLNPVTGELSGSAAGFGDFSFVVQVKDSRNATATQALSLHVERAIPPVQIVTTALPKGTATLRYEQQLEAAGGLGAYAWTLSSGTLPKGLTLSSAGVIAGTPTVEGTVTVTFTAADASDASRKASRAFTIVIGPAPNMNPTVTLLASEPVVQVGSMLTLTADAHDVDGTIVRVDFFADGAPIGAATGTLLQVQWLVATPGAHRFTAVATDNRGATASNAVAVTSRSEIVLYGRDVRQMAGNFQLVADATAAGGMRLSNVNKDAAKVSTPAASPAHYADFTFYAEAGRPYHLWIRGKADANHWANDSIHVQFSGSVDAAGVAIDRMGTTDSLWVGLEEDSGVGVAGWGWNDNGYGRNVMGPAIYFATTGAQTVRFQQREDGLSIDQIVLSPATYLNASPGVTKNDTTIVAR